ncbi:MAG: DMT family transporter [Alphaproteobacteria bacterium]|nr:DMT family transporter [Alphaproteobacteria bacterium]
MVAASASFTAMISFVKVARGWDMHTPELMTWRSLAAIPVLYLFSGLDWRIQRWDLLFVRCVFGFCAMFCFFSSTAGLGIGELNVLTKLQPLFVAILAPLVLGRSERAGPEVVGALALGMLGTIALVWPVLGETPVRFTSALFGIAAAVFSAAAHTTLRKLGETERPTPVVFWFQIAVGIGAIAGTFASTPGYSIPTVSRLPLLIGIGLTALTGQLWMTRAYAIDRAARIAAASYVTPLMGFAVDAVFFDLVPTMWTAVGALLVVAAGGVLLWKDPEEAT